MALRPTMILCAVLAWFGGTLGMALAQEAGANCGSGAGGAISSCLLGHTEARTDDL